MTDSLFCYGCETYFYRSRTLTQIGVPDYCWKCLMRKSGKRLERLWIDVTAYRLRKQLRPGVQGRRADWFWVWFDHLTHEMSCLNEINNCPYCLHYIETKGWPGRFSNWDEARRMRPPELHYPGLWWHINEWFNLPYRQRFAPCLNCGKWLTRRFVMKDGGVCLDCRNKYGHS